MARAATSRLKVNPALGSPPTLEFRPVGELLIDASYQRSIDTAASQTLIRKIAMFWDWSLCQPLAVSRRPDGGLTIVDGQHRAAAAKMRGDIPHLPCVITSYANSGDEAAAFVALNQMRRPLSAIDLFKAAVAAEDKEALLITDMLKAAGLSLANHTNYTAWKVGQVANIGALLRYHRNSGEEAVRTALLVLAKAFPGQVLQYAGTIFPGLAAVAKDELRLRMPATEIMPTLARIASAKTQDEWRREIKAAVGESGGMAREASEMLFRRYWRDRHTSRAIVAPTETRQPLPPPKPVRSFEEQVAAVERGEARVVPAFHPRPVAPDRTLGGAPPEFI